jgi:hypothetical protein
LSVPREIRGALKGPQVNVADRAPEASSLRGFGVIGGGYIGKTPVPVDVKAIQREMDGASPRATILVGASLLEYALEELLRNSLRPPASNIEAEAIFSFNGVLGTFSDKIWMAYFMGIIGPATRSDIDIVRAIRNECAHNMNVVTFEMPAIRDRCLSMSDKRTNKLVPSKDPRRIFLGSVSLLAGLLIAKTVDQDELTAGLVPPHSFIDD